MFIYLKNVSYIIWINNKLYLINVENVTKFYYYGVIIFYFGILTMSKKT